jgi:hypothetical protein
MKIETARLFCAAAAGSALLYLYMSFIISFLSNPNLYPQTTVETVVVAAQIVKVVIILSVRRLRFAKSATIWIIFALETLVIPFLTGAYFVTGDRGYLELFRSIFAIWPVALLLVAPPYLIFRFSAEMFMSAKLTKVMTSAVTEFSFLAFTASLFLLTGASSVGSMESVLTLFAIGIRTAARSGEGITLPSSLLTPPSIILYLALVVYATLPANDVSDLYVPTVLLVPLLGTVTLLVWVYFAAESVSNALISLTIPSVAIAGFLWWIGRRGK